MTANERRPTEQADRAAEGRGEGQESMLTVLLALAANAGVGVLKLIAGLVSGSGALLSEAAHSAGDTSTELLLLAAVRRSGRPADRQHPFGYGKERFFWSMLAAITILISGAAFSVALGLHTFTHPEASSHLLLNYAVLAGAAVLEAISLRQALRQARAEAREHQVSAADYVSDPDDPTVKSVVLEDSAALVGIGLAAAGVSLHAATGQAVWDGAASLAIGALLVVVSFLLARTSMTLLIGKQADVRLVRAISDYLEEQDEVLDVVDLLTMLTGSESVLLCARVDFVDEVSSAELERVCVRIEAGLHERFDVLDEIFLEPVPRSDPELRRRVLGRYGRVLADEPG